MKKLVFLIYVCVVFFSCQHTPSAYKKVNDKISYKLIQLGDGKSLDEAEVVQLEMIVKSETGDTLHYVPNYNYFITTTDHVIDSVFQLFNEGDSVDIKIERSLFNGYLKFYKVMQKQDGYVHLHTRFNRAYDSTAAIKVQRELLSKRELEEQRRLKKYLQQESDSLEEMNGVYRKVIKRTNGIPIKPGSEVSIHYKGSFLNGFIFDNTYEKTITPSFVYGQEFQMIDGLHTALKGMKEGESVKIILPSRHAFGGEGSLAGIVPPYTAVIYEVNIIKVIN